MENEEQATSHETCCHKKHHRSNGAHCAVYGMAFIGATIYFVQHADTFWMGVLGVLKAVVWPAMLVYHALGFLQI